jgi:hypothetical protein
MRLKYIVIGAAFAGFVGAAALASKADAQEGIYVPLLTYRTGPFAGGGIPIANGACFSHAQRTRGGIGGVGDHRQLDGTNRSVGATNRSKTRSRSSSIARGIAGDPKGIG